MRSKSMMGFLPLPLLLFLLLLATLISVASPSPLSPPSDIQEKQLRNIVDALLGGGDFANWANFLSSAKPLTLPLSATLFIPSNAALSAFNPVTASGLSVDPFLIAYHIVPQHLTFSSLQKLPLHARIPTLLTSKSIIITNNSRVNFSVDDSVVTHPDMFNSSGFSVHGVSKILDYKVHGTGNVTFNQEDEDGIHQQAQRRPRPPLVNRNNSRHEGKDLPDNSTDFKPSYSAAPSSSYLDFFLLSLGLGFAVSLKID